MRRYGYIKDAVDKRDLTFSITAPAGPLPPSFDNRGPFMPPVYDQLQVGSCVGNATAAALQFDRRKQGFSPDWTPSRLFIYWCARAAEASTAEDGGCQIRDAIKAVAKFGDCPEEVWPYDVSKVCVKPSSEAFSQAIRYLALRYARLPGNDLTTMRRTLAGGFPFVVGIQIYSSFESDAVAANGAATIPGRRESLLGGHAVCVVGYDDRQRRFVVRNSWGPAWGQAGYFTLPYRYLERADLASDFWVITATE